MSEAWPVCSAVSTSITTCMQHLQPAQCCCSSVERRPGLCCALATPARHAPGKSPTVHRPPRLHGPALSCMRRPSSRSAQAGSSGARSGARHAHRRLACTSVPAGRVHHVTGSATQGYSISIRQLAWQLRYRKAVKYHADVRAVAACEVFYLVLYSVEELIVWICNTTLRRI